MRYYETTFIVDPVLSGEEIKATAQTYIEHLRKEGCDIVFVDEMGLRTLAYPINKRNSGVYYCVEYAAPNGVFLNSFELAMRRDERIMRFLSVALDKFGVQYNVDKRNGKIGKAKRHKQEKPAKQEPRAHEVSRKKADSPALSGVPSGDAEAAKEEEE
ncbi:MAG: 30S ribosomal protein S6 [Saprospiraceae bacterium]